MCRFWRIERTQRARLRTAAGVVAVLLGGTLPVQASVTTVGDPATGYGVSPNVFTVNPFDAAVTTRANRGITQNRQLRQTFKNPSTFNVGQINFSFDVTGGSTVGSAADTGLKLAFYEVDDVLSANWTPGALIREVTILPGTMPASVQMLSISLTGGDVFTLPQRNAGTAGYGVQISTPNALASDGNPGVLWFTNVSTPVDYFADGRYYVEAGASNSFRDVGLSLIASAEVACDPGDVNCTGGVTLDDLAIVGAHFRQSGGRELGDLTGNGFIDFDDFQQWKQNFPGAFPGSGSLADFFGSVPEPTSAVLCFSGVIGLTSMARRRARTNSSE